jgi:hypothetical protein
MLGAIILIQIKEGVMSHTSLIKSAYSIFLLLLLTTITHLYAADTLYKPFVLAATAPLGDVSALTQTVTGKLTGSGFQVIGQYAPYADATVLVITNDKLQQHATESEFGAFGAALRVSITKTKDEIQVAFTNPSYMAHVYQMKSDLADVKEKLAAALGNQGEYGPEEGLSAKALHDYHYKFLMPYFSDRINLHQYKDQKTALDAVENILKTGKDGVKKVYRLDLPGKEESIVGVQLTGPSGNCSGDEYIMSRIDFKKTKSTGHLPYEIVVTKGKIYALPAEFRIAINFPDLSMMGSNSFASIMCAPNAIQTALTHAVGGKMDTE